MSLKMQKVGHSQKMTTLWQGGKNNVKVCLRNMATRVTVQHTVMTMSRANQARQRDEDDDELIPLRSEVESAVNQLKNGKAT